VRPRACTCQRHMPPPSESRLPSDLLLYNGSIRTMDPLAPRVEAVLIRNGRVQARGSSAVLLPLAGTATAIDLAGRTALPGLEDAHLHLCEHGLSLSRLRLEQCASLEQVLCSVQEAASAPGAAWVRGHGWDHNVWPLPAKPTRFDLDRVAPARPVALDSKDLHSLWVNSAALKLAGIDANTPNVPGGEIQRDSSGLPLGVLSESARQLIERVMPAATASERLAAARLAVADAARLGLTGVHSCEAPESFAALAELDRNGELALRVWHMLPLRYLGQVLALGLQTGYGTERLRIGHVKMFADGALGSGTAEMIAPYEDAPDSLGVAATCTEELYEGVRKAAEGGLASAIHAIGDAANRRVLDVYERVAREVPERRLRQRIEHVQLITPEDQARLSRLGVIASMQPVHCTQDMIMAQRRWGDRCHYAYPWRSLSGRGARLAFGTDTPVEAMNPLAGLYAAVTRRRPGPESAEAWYPEESLSLDQALRAYTWGSAYAAYGERERGSLTSGKWGDVTVLSGALSDNEPDALLELCVDYTIMGGQVIYQR
jgi:predicted amidohydrolase YtcJ